MFIQICIGIIFPEITAVGISPPTTGIEPRIQIDLSGTEDRTEYHQLENVELISLRVYHRNNGFSRIKITSKNTKLVGISIENGDNMYIYIHCLVGGWPTPLKNMSSSMRRITSHTVYEMKNIYKIFETTNQTKKTFPVVISSWLVPNNSWQPGFLWPRDVMW